MNLCDQRALTVPCRSADRKKIAYQIFNEHVIFVLFNMTQVLPQIQVRFTTNQRQYIVTDSAILVPTNLRRYGLSEIINHLLGTGNQIIKTFHQIYLACIVLIDFITEKPIPFDFMINGEFLRCSLDEYLKSAGLSTV